MKLDAIQNVLQLIADGTPFQVSHLYDDQYIISVTNDRFDDEQDLGHDPYFCIITTGPV